MARTYVRKDGSVYRWTQRGESRRTLAQIRSASKVRHAKILALARAGLPAWVIAERTGASQTEVHRMCSNAGIRLTTAREWDWVS